jgi:hypothetical protein
MPQQAKMLEDKCKELRDEIKIARDELDRVNGLLTDTVPRAELNAARKVHSTCSTCMSKIHASCFNIELHMMSKPFMPQIHVCK